MKRMILPGTDLAISKLVFGTGSLHLAGGHTARMSLLAEAISAGYTHFDTAPYYGFGSCERILGEVLKRHPDATVTTKVGLYAPGGEDQPEAAVFMRKALGRLVPVLSRAMVDFSLARAKKCFDASRRRLGRECIDIYLLHEPAARLIAADEWRGWLEGCQRNGSVRYFGVAGSADQVKAMLTAAPDLCNVIQTGDSIDGREADQLSELGRSAQLTYGYFSSAKRNHPELSGVDILQRSIERNPNGAIIVSTSRSTRLWEMAVATSRSME